MTLGTGRIDTTTGAAVASAPERGAARAGLLRRHPRLVVGGGLVVLLFFAALFAPLLTHYDPIVGDVSDGLQAPSAAHWLATDDQRRDMMARLPFGARLS